MFFILTCKHIIFSIYDSNIPNFTYEKKQYHDTLYVTNIGFRLKGKYINSEGGNVKFRDIKKCYVLLDFNNIVWRAYHATVKQNMVNDDGINVGFIVGFFKVLAFAINMAKKNGAYPKLIIAEDRVPTRKRELYANNQHLFMDRKPDRNWDGKSPKLRIKYKGNRPSKLDIGYNPIEICREFTSCIEHTLIYKDGEEADDVIASYVHNNWQGNDIMLFSTDKDLWQLLRWPIKIYGQTNDQITFKDIHEHFAGTSNILLHKMITGDAGDNVKGVLRFPFKSTLSSFKRCDGTLNGFARCLEEDGKDKARSLLIRNIKLIQFNWQIVHLHIMLDYTKKHFPIEETSVDVRSKWVQLCSKYQVPSLRNSAFIDIF